MNKTDILDKLVKMSLYTNEYDKYEEAADHLTWLFEPMEKEVEKFFFPKKEAEINVQLSENKEC